MTNSISSRLDGVDLERAPPHDMDAERGVLGSAMLDYRVFDDVAAIVRADDFYSPANRKVFEQMLAMHRDRTPIDVTLLIDRLKTAGDFDAVGGATFLNELAMEVPTAANASWYARTVRGKSDLRAVILAATATLRDAYDARATAADILGEASQRFIDIGAALSAGSEISISKAMVETVDAINDRIANPKPRGIATPWLDVDRKLGGMRPGELLILAARPGVGKTSAALNILRSAALSGAGHVLAVSLEMSSHELCEKMLSYESNVAAEFIRDARLDPNERRKLIEAQSLLAGLPVTFDDSPRRSLFDIASQARMIHRRTPLALVIIDYLGQIDPENPKDPRYEQVGKNSRGLKILARELKVPILCLAQVNRDVDKKVGGKKKAGANRPKLSSLRESGNIEQDADVVMFLHREEMYDDNPDLQGQAELIVEKNRHGQTGIVNLVWDASTTSYLSAAKGRDFEDNFT